MPRSVPLVGGLVLSLMTPPTIIIATRSSLQSVPLLLEKPPGNGSIRDAGRLTSTPSAMPGIFMEQLLV